MVPGMTGGNAGDGAAPPASRRREGAPVAGDAADPAAPDRDDVRIALVRNGYDRMADRYAAWAATVRDAARERTTARLLALLPPAAAVLDLGCGNGLPTAHRLIDAGHRVTAVDHSAAQVARCRANVPEATAMQAEMTAVSFPAGSFAAVVSFSAITHVPRARHADLFRRVAGWLRPGGLFAACLGAGESDDVEPDWLGVPMPFSHFGADANLALLREAGFSILQAEVAETIEDEAAVAFLWVIARTANPR
jgi:SAM-dependent methyltransferase